MVTVRRSAPKSKSGCQTCKIRRVKCDESQPNCQRCTSTGRTCDGYIKDFTPTSPTTVTVLGSPLAPITQSISVLEDIQERRSFDFFRSETVLNIGGFFGSSVWNLVLQACSREPVVRQALIALGALHESTSISYLLTSVDGGRALRTSFPLRQYAKALGGLRRYLSMEEDLDLNIVLICALIHISIEVIQSQYVNASIHLENSLQLLRQSSRHIHDPTPDHSSYCSKVGNVDVEIDLSRAFLRLDIQASTYQGMRAPALAGRQTQDAMPSRFSSISHAKDVLDSLTGRLHILVLPVIEECRYRKGGDVPSEAFTQVAHLQQAFEVWDHHFEKYLGRSTSKFSRQEQLAINALLISHKLSTIEASTCTHFEESIFDQFDIEFDEIVTLAATIIWARRTTTSHGLNFSLDIGVIYPLYWTAIKCREPWIRQRAMSLLRSVNFQEGVWDAAAQARIAEVAIAKEQICGISGLSSSWRPPEFARVYSVGTNVLDPVRRVAEVVLTQKLNGIDGPWTDHVEWITW